MGPAARRGEKAARLSRERLGLSPDEPVDVLDAVEITARVAVALIALEDGFAGAHVVRRGGSVIFCNAADAPVRQRFTIAHEFGHHELGHNTRVDTWASLYRDLDPEEVSANAFAAEFLAPRVAVARLWKSESLGSSPALDTVVSVASRFGLSAQAMRYRLETAGVITDASHCAKLDAEIADRETLRAAAWKARALEDRLSQLAGGTYVSAGPLRDTALGRVSVAEIAGLTGHEAGNVERALRLSELL